MTITRDRMQTIGWGTTLAVCLALTVALGFRVNAVKSEVALADRQIAKLERENNRLRNEFDAEASYEQIDKLNRMEFGQAAPTAAQFVTSDRQVAMLGKPRDVGAPAPIRMAGADPEPTSPADSVGETRTLVAMVSPDDAAEARPAPARAEKPREDRLREDRPREGSRHADRPHAEKPRHTAASEHAKDHLAHRRAADAAPRHREASLDDLLGRIDRHRGVRE